MIAIHSVGQTCMILSTCDAAAVFSAHLRDAPEEHLAVAHLDRDLRLISFTVTSSGSNHHIAMPIREIVSEALMVNATSVVIAHNHPSGIALPSAADRDCTRALARVMRPLGIQLQDHLIFAADRWISFRGLGLM